MLSLYRLPRGPVCEGSVAGVRWGLFQAAALEDDRWRQKLTYSTDAAPMKRDVVSETLTEKHLIIDAFEPEFH